MKASDAFELFFESKKILTTLVEHIHPKMKDASDSQDYSTYLELKEVSDYLTRLYNSIQDELKTHKVRINTAQKSNVDKTLDNVQYYLNKHKQRSTQDA